jgi:hypothetical protein
MAGYAFGAAMSRDRASSERICLWLGLLATALFVARGIATVGSGPAPYVLRVLNQNKYRDSQIFLLMTLGPTITLIPLIHALACVVSLVRDGSVNGWLIANHPVAPPDLPPGYEWSLPLLYLMFIVAVAPLYLPCRWYARLKGTRKYPWMSYL